MNTKGRVAPDTKCRGKIRKGPRMGELCTRPAGWGTDHPGSGRCKLHGGANPIRHGRYSKISRERLGGLYAQFEADPDPLNLLPELHLMRAQLAHFLETYGPSPMVADLADRVARIVDLIQKHKSGGVLTLATVHRIMEQLGATVAKHVKDEDVLGRIERDWGAIQLTA